MAIVSRGFRSRRREPDQRVPPGQYVTDDFPVLSAGSDPADRDRPLVVRARLRARRTRLLVVARADGAADRHLHRRHPLRDPLVQAGHPLARGVAGPPADRGRHECPVRDGALLRRLHDQRAAGRPAWGQGLDRVRVRRSTAAARARGTGAAAHPAPLLLEVGQVGPRAAPAGERRARASGSATATACTATRGPRTGTPDGHRQPIPGLRLAGRQGRLGDRGHRARPGHRPRRARLAG